MTPGSKLLQIMADNLNREQPAIKNWRDLASKLDIPADVSREFSGESAWQNGKSPTKEVLEWVAAQFPDTTLKEVVKALDKIQRNDAIQIITKQFPDTVGESKSYGCCCLWFVSTRLPFVMVTYLELCTKQTAQLIQTEINSGEL